MSDEFWAGYLTATLIAIVGILMVGNLAHCGAVEEIIEREARVQGFEPEVAMAVARVESGLNPGAVGARGEIGLFQIRPEFAPVPREALFNPKVNARLGIQLLVYYRTFCPLSNGLEWVTCFNQGLRNPKYPQRLPYYQKVIRALAEGK